MSITIKVEEIIVNESGAKEKKTRELVGKLNYYAVEAASKFYDGVNAEILSETGEQGAKNLLDTYNNIVITGSHSHIREVLWFIFKDPQNGGLTLPHIEQFLNERMSGDEEEFDMFVDEVLSTMEESGFFMKQIRQNMKNLDETVLPQMTKMIEESHKETEKITGKAYFEQLSLITTRGIQKGFYIPLDTNNNENSEQSLVLSESEAQA